MNLFTRLWAMLLACLLVLSLGMTAACADTCYETLKYTFSLEENEDFAWLGQGVLAESEEPASPEEDIVIFYVSLDSGFASVSGRNADGTPEYCMWPEADPSAMLLATVQVAASYEHLCSYLDECTQLVMVMDGGSEGERIYVASPEDAQAYLTLLEQATDAAETVEAAE